MTAAVVGRGPALHTEEATWDNWLAGATDTQLACRDARHAWEPVTVNLQRRQRFYEVQEACSRGCGTTKRRWVSAADGQPLNTPVYTYADGFLAKGTGAFGSEHRGLARLARVQRLYARSGRGR